MSLIAIATAYVFLLRPSYVCTESKIIGYHERTPMTTTTSVDTPMPVVLDENTNISSVCIMLNMPLSRCLYDVIGIRETLEMQNVSHEHTYFRAKRFTVIYASVAIVSSVFGVLGNTVVLIVSFRQCRELPSCKLHIAELAIVDFIFSVVQIINTVPLYWTNKWIYGLPMCKVIRTLMEMGSFLTVFFILTICLERYFLIVYPFDSMLIEGQIKHITVLIAFSVVFATVVPYFIGMGMENDSERCVMFHGHKRHMYLSYNWFVVGIYFIIPICVMLTAYIGIIKALSSTNFNKSLQEGAVVLKRMKQNRRIIRITISILGIFILCTLPTRIIMIYIEIIGNDIKDMNLYFALGFIGYVTYPLQSTLNPILYSMVDHEWRKNVKKTLECLRKTCLCYN